MIVDGVFEGYDNAALILDEWLRKHMYKLVSRLQITNILNEIHKY